MVQTVPMKIIGHIRTEFPAKFGIPRQSGLVDALRGKVVFTPEYRNPDALRGLEGFSHLWLLWHFDRALREDWSPTVRPPRLGGNARMGVFATRSPFRPNGLGLSCVRLVGVEQDAALGPVVHVAGADLMDGTPIFDLKPYLPYADSRPEAMGGFAAAGAQAPLEVEFPPRWLELVAECRREALRGVLACDPRPSYQDDPERVYGLAFGGVDVRFTVAEGRLTVVEVTQLEEETT